MALAVALKVALTMALAVVLVVALAVELAVALAVALAVVLAVALTVALAVTSVTPTLMTICGASLHWLTVPVTKRLRNPRSLALEVSAAALSAAGALASAVALYHAPRGTLAFHLLCLRPFVGTPCVHAVCVVATPPHLQRRSPSQAPSLT